MKKKIIYSLMFILTLVVSPIAIKSASYNANYNGSGSGNSVGVHGGSCDYNKYFCPYNNYHETILVRMTYVNQGNITDLGYVYISNDRSRITILSSSLNTSKLVNYTDVNNKCGKNGYALSSNLHGDGASANLKRFFAEDKDVFDCVIKEYMGLDPKSLSLANQPSDPTGRNPAQYGYRMLIEPVKSGYVWNVPMLRTIKQMAANPFYIKYFNDYKYHLLLYLTYDDVGLTKADTGHTTSSSPDWTVASDKSGFGLNAIDVTPVIEEYCPQKKAKLTPGTKEYLKLQNDTIWNLVDGTPTEQDKTCYTCEEYIKYYFTDYTQRTVRTDNPWFSGNIDDAKTKISQLIATGYINWTSANCKVPSKDVPEETCASYKEENPTAELWQMEAANVKWPGCYSCEPGNANYDVRYASMTDACDEPTDYCSFELDIDISNNCTVSDRSHVYDIENWGCIFSSRSAEETNVQDHFYQEDMESNRFCDVYCREEIDYRYPGTGMVVLAGQRFTIGTQFSNFPVLKPVRFTATTTCRTTSDSKEGEIDLDGFKEVYNDADDVVSEKWDVYQKAIADRKATQAATGRVTGSGQCCTGTGENRTCSGSWTTTTYSGTATHGVYSGSVSWTYTTGCTTSGSSKTSKISSMQTAENTALTAYNNAVTARTNVIKELHQCNTFQYTNRKFNPNVYFKYEEEMYGGDVYNLSSSVSISSSSKYYTGGNAEETTGTRRGSASWGTSSYKSASEDIKTVSDLSSLKGSTTTIAKNKCVSGQKCTKTATDTYENNNWVEQTTTKEYSYYLPAGVYEYITKPSGLSVNTLAEAQAESTQYYYIGTSNLPIHYSREEGNYDYEIDYDTFGQSGSLEHKFDKFIFDGVEIGSPYGSSLGIYNYLWETTWTGSRKIKDMIASCAESGGHMHHSFVSKINIPISPGTSTTWLDLFKETSCYKDYGCGGSSVIKCTYYYDTNGVRRTAGSSSSSSTNQLMYRQIQQCINSKRLSNSIRVAFDSDTAYKCTYEVENKLFKEETNYKDLNVIYRTISLNNPFPGQSGTNRNPGSNWNWRPLINTYITNNRDTETENMYNDLDPLYKITLTPAIIQEIRKYNDAQDSKSITFYNSKSERIDGVAGYSDFNLECTGGKYCLSKFIRNSISIGGRSYNFSRYFSGCGIDDTGLRCNTDEEW